jgi:aminopeptidase-like protein
MLNKYGLSRNIGGIYKNEKNFPSFILNILFYSDGLRSTSDISRRIKVQESKVLKVSNYLEKKNILCRIA